MKIIGKTTHGYILEASNDDVANLCGWFSEWSDGMKGLKVGDKVNISEMYKKLYVMKEHEGDLNGISNTLKRMSEDLLPAIPIIREINDET